MKKKITLILLFVIMANVSIGQTWFEQNIDAARRGNSGAQYAIGNCYADGNGVAKNPEQAFYWYMKAAEQGHPDAQWSIGNCYEKGKGVSLNYREAVNWYEKAGEQGKGLASYRLAVIYEKGLGGLRNNKKSLYWYKMLLEQDGDQYPSNTVAYYKQKIQLLEQKVQEEEREKLAQQQAQAQLQQPKPIQVQIPQRLSIVDKNIPQNVMLKEHLFAIIIGNEKYSDETDVPFAENDAMIFKEYCQKTIGINGNHIRYIANAGYNDIRRAVNWLKQGLEAYGGEGSAIFYYAGHGIPDEAQKTAYLLPADGIGSDVESAYSLERLYQTLGEMPAKSITVFLDACFSGAKRDGGMMASARGVAIKTKAEEPKGKMVVFTAAQGDETAYPYKSQQHGMFTYYLLRKLQETKGDVTLGELADYITREVKRQSFDENSRSQTPTVNASASISSIWRNLKLK